MGGKRPDQHNIDPGEAGSTDYKWRREGRSQEENHAEADKQRYQANREEQPMIPEEPVNPKLRELRERKAGPQNEKGMSEDERVDEASEESFPASDPPAQP